MHEQGASSSLYINKPTRTLLVARSPVNICPSVRPFTSILSWTQSRGVQQHSVWLSSDAVAVTLIPSPRYSSPVGSVSQRSICLTRKVPASSILMLSYKQTRWVRVEWSGGDGNGGNDEDQREGVAAHPPLWCGECLQ